jgi:holliday junction DNA helicase RuvB
MNIRPQRLDEFVGQQDARRILGVLIAAAKRRNEPVPHVLMSGPAGLGKTSLARIIANETSGNLVEVVGSAVKNPAEMTQHLVGLKPHDVLFIDEVHALGRNNEEVLYGAMEDGTVAADQAGFNDLMKQIGIRNGEKSKVTHKLPAFSLVAATTLLGLCSAPLRSRFRQVLELKPYTNEELQVIVTNAGRKFGFEMDSGFAVEIARRSRGTARIAVNNMLWVRDVVEGDGGVATKELLNAAFQMKGIDEQGLTNGDREYLRRLFESEEAVGVETLASALGESTETLEQSIEPFLLQQGFIGRTPRGRVATEKARTLFEEATR